MLIEKWAADPELQVGVPYRRMASEAVAALRAVPETREPGWRDIATAPKDRFILGALVMDGVIWRVHEMRHNGLAFYTKGGGSLPKMTHWMELAPIPPPGGPTP